MRENRLRQFRDMQHIYTSVPLRTVGILVDQATRFTGRLKQICIEALQEI